MSIKQKLARTHERNVEPIDDNNERWSPKPRNYKIKSTTGGTSEKCGKKWESSARKNNFRYEMASFVKGKGALRERARSTYSNLNWTSK